MLIAYYIVYFTSLRYVKWRNSNNTCTYCPFANLFFKIITVYKFRIVCAPFCDVLHTTHTSKTLSIYHSVHTILIVHDMCHHVPYIRRCIYKSAHCCCNTIAINLHIFFVVVQMILMQAGCAKQFFFKIYGVIHKRLVMMFVCHAVSTMGVLNLIVLLWSFLIDFIYANNIMMSNFHH